MFLNSKPWVIAIAKRPVGLKPEKKLALRTGFDLYDFFNMHVKFNES